MSNVVINNRVCDNPSRGTKQIKYLVHYLLSMQTFLTDLLRRTMEHQPYRSINIAITGSSSSEVNR